MKEYILLFSFLVCGISYIKCEGELTVLYHPKEITFHDERPLYTSELKWVFGTILGYLSGTSKEWQDLHVEHPFDFNDIALIIAAVPGIPSFNFTHLFRIPLMEDEVLANTIKELDLKTTTIFQDYNLVPMFKHVNLSKIELSREDKETGPLLDNSYKMFDILHAEIDKPKQTSGPRLYWLDFPRYHEPDEDYLKTGLTLIQTSLKSIADKAREHLKPLVVLIAYEDKISLTRRKRQVEPTPTAAPDTLSSLNVADDYSENFPVIFNIMLWFSIALLFSLISISMVIANMDPGRDSIIYRMTSTRMKKDN